MSLTTDASVVSVDYRLPGGDWMTYDKAVLPESSALLEDRTLTPTATAATATATVRARQR